MSRRKTRNRNYCKLAAKVLIGSAGLTAQDLSHQVRLMNKSYDRLPQGMWGILATDKEKRFGRKTENGYTLYYPKKQPETEKDGNTDVVDE